VSLPSHGALHTVEEIADQLRLQPETVRQMAREGRIPAHKVGRVWRFVPEEIGRWLQREVADERSAPSRCDRGAELVLPLYEVDGVASSEPNGTAFKDPAFTENRSEPVHRWVPWIAGFSSGFVRDCLSEYLPGVRPASALVLDPFAGVGTTLVEAYRRGYNTVGFEINPYAVLAARAKLEASDVSLTTLEAWIKAFQLFVRETADSGAMPKVGIAPAAFRSRIPFFSPAIERQVLWALQFIHSTEDPKLRDLFLVAFGSVMVKFSNYTYEPSLTTRPGCGKPLVEQADVAAVIVGKLREMLADCHLFQQTLNRARRTLRRDVIHDSIFDADRHLPRDSVDLAITSPPYLNNYHYVRNTRPHLFWLRFVEDTAGLRQVEEASFGTFWQTVRDGEPLDLKFELPELEALLARVRETNTEKGAYGGPGWANYAAQYFNDTHRFCEVLHHLLKPGARIVVVIGNSILQGVEIKVEEFLAQIGEMQGLRREAIHMLRTKRVGNSIIRSSVRNAAATSASLYEVAVVLRKP
jgi:excisionase family DNA binding protein